MLMRDTQFYLSPTHMFNPLKQWAILAFMSDRQHHRTLPGTRFPSRWGQEAELGWVTGCVPRLCACDAVTHRGANRAQHGVMLSSFLSSVCECEQGHRADGTSSPPLCDAAAAAARLSWFVCSSVLKFFPKLRRLVSALLLCWVALAVCCCSCPGCGRGVLFYRVL